MTYNGTETAFYHVQSFVAENEGECELQEGEFIQEVLISYNTYVLIHSVIGGIKFVTSHNQICGPFGKTDMTDSDAGSGHHLLYIEGRAGHDVFDKLTFIFESCS